MSERHSLPGVFLTASLDDAHQLLTIKLSYPSYSNQAFPGFADAMHEREGSQAHESAKLSAEQRTRELQRVLYEHETYTASKQHGMEFRIRFDEARFQRLVAENPVATSLMYEAFIDALVEVLIGLPNDKQRRKTFPMLDCLKRPARRGSGATHDGAPSARRHSARLGEHNQPFAYGEDDSRSRRPRGAQLRDERQCQYVQSKGIFGIVPAWVAVTETSAREALHWHAALCTALSPRLVARMAARPEFRDRLLQAIETQVRAHVPWEVHAVHAVRQVLLPRQAPRVSFLPVLTSILEDPLERKQVHFYGKQMGDHSCGLGARGTCGKKPAGAHMCRFLKPSGCDNDELYIAQAVTTSEDGTHDGVLDENGRFTANLFRGTGQPPLCSEGCLTYWPGCNRGHEDMLNIKLYEPQQWEEPLVTIDGTEPILPRDPRNLVMEHARPKSLPHTSPAVQDDAVRVQALELYKRLRSATLDDAAAVKQLVRDVASFEPVAQLLECSMLHQTRDALAQASEDQAANILLRWQKLECANGCLVEFNELLTLLSASNTAPVMLGAGGAAAGALFYLVKYFTKENVRLSHALPLLLDARKHLETFGSQSNDKSPAAEAKYVLSRSLNKMDSEMSFTQLAAMLLGLQAEQSSENYLYVDLHGTAKVAAALDAQRRLERSVVQTAEDSEGSHRSDGDTDEDDDGDIWAAIDPRARQLGRGTTPVFNINGRPVSIDWPTLYAYRGDALHFLSFEVYKLVIRIADIPGGQKARGRRQSIMWRFAVGFPARGHLVQVEREKLGCPLHTSGRFPRLLQRDADGRQITPQWQRKQDRASGFYVSNLIPWDGKLPRELTEATLRAYVRQQQLAARPLDALALAQLNADARWAPPDPDDMSHAPERDPRTAAELAVEAEERRGRATQAHSDPTQLHPARHRVIAEGRLQLLRNYLHGLKQPEIQRQAGKQIRARFARRWSDREKEERDCMCQRGGKEQSAQEQIEAALALQEMRKVSLVRVRRAQRAAHSLADLEQQLPRATSAPRTSPSAPPPDMDVEAANDWDQAVGGAVNKVNSVMDKYGTELTNVETECNQAAIARANVALWARSKSDLRTANSRFDLNVSETEIAREIAEWKQQYGAAYKRGELVPPPPLNRKQREAGVEVLDAVRVLSGQQQAAELTGRTREQYSQAAHAQTKHLHFLLLGPGGAGKSLMMRWVLAVMVEEDLGGAIFTAYTGVAVTALPRPSATYCNLTSIPGDAGSQLTDLGPPSTEQKLKFRKLVLHDSLRLTLFVLDEVSFIGSPHLHHLDQRLQKLMECSLPFGGLVVLLAGDFAQLPPVGCPSLPIGMLQAALPKDVLEGLGLKNKLTLAGADRKGVDLLRKFRQLTLTTLMRTDDVEHGKVQENMRSTTCTKAPVQASWIAKMQMLTAAAIRKHGDKLRFAKIAVLSNGERSYFNYHQARNFAKHFNRVFIYWDAELVGKERDALEHDMMFDMTELRIAEKSGLIGIYVRGAPATIALNYDTGSEIVNGCDGVLHSLVLADGGSLATYVATFARQSDIDNVWECKLPEPPYAVNIQPSVSKEAEAALLKRGLTLAKDNKTLVVPVVLSKRGKTYRPISVFAAESGVPCPLTVKQLDYELAFAVTAHKLQSKSEDFLIINAGPREGLLPPMRLMQLYVLVSRVRTNAGMYVLGVDPCAQPTAHPLFHA